MAEIAASMVSISTTVSATSGQRISIRILNADGSVASVVHDDSVPAGKTLNGSVSYNGVLV